MRDFEWLHRVRWSDVDANRHMRNTAFSEVAIDARLAFMAEAGCAASEFEAGRFGPVIIREDIRYRREVLLDDEITVRLWASGMAPDVSHWRIFHEIVRPDGKMAATLEVTGAFMDLDARKLIAPPAVASTPLNMLVHSADFEELPSLVQRRDRAPQHP